MENPMNRTYLTCLMTTLLLTGLTTPSRATADETITLLLDLRAQVCRTVPTPSSLPMPSAFFVPEPRATSTSLPILCSGSVSGPLNPTTIVLTPLSAAVFSGTWEARTHDLPEVFDGSVTITKYLFDSQGRYWINGQLSDAYGSSSKISFSLDSMADLRTIQLTGTTVSSGDSTYTPILYIGPQSVILPRPTPTPSSSPTSNPTT